MKKRGQLTVFMILGLVVLLSVAIIVFLQHNTAIFQPREIYPPEIAPINTLVEKCVESYGTSAVYDLGLHGGYIELPLDMRSDPLAYFSLMPDSIFKVPLWYYNGVSRMPTKEQMQDQISAYVNANVISCVNNFSAFDDQFIIEQGALSTETVIADDKVSIKTNFPLKITNKANDETTNRENFYANVDVGLGKLYDTASKIMVKENDEAFLETLTMEIVAGSTYPYEGFEITCKPKMWNIESEIKPGLENMLKYNMHFLTFKNTNYLDSGDPYYQKIYNIDVGLEKYQNVRVTTDATFNDAWAFNSFKISPSKGTVVEPMNYNIPIVGQCFKVYHHRYTINYPMLFQLTDEKGFTFNFATPVMILNNEPNREKNIFYPGGEDLSITSEDYCGKAEYRLKVTAKDIETGEAVKDAAIAYRCVKYKCSIGKTDVPRFANGIPKYGEDPVLDAMFPFCINGLLIASHPDYLDSYAFVDTTPEMTTHFAEIEMTPLKHLDYSFVVVDENGKKRTIKDDEMVILYATNKDTNFEKSIYYPSEATDYTNFSLMLGNYGYNIDIKLVKNETIVAGYYLEDWQLNYEDLVNANKVTFYLLTKSNEPKTPEEFATFWNDYIIIKSKNNMPRIT